MATQQTAIWKCPALCGCELSISAQWVKGGEIEDGRLIQYQHPIPKTIIDISVENVCVDHTSFLTDPLPADPYGGAPGYINPIPASPTEAERLYIHLYKYTGQRWKPDTCGCHVYLTHNRFANSVQEAKRHGKHSKKCPHHVDDDDTHTKAREQATRKQRIVNRIAEQLSIDADTIAWEFQASGDPEINRVLHLTLPGTTLAQRTAVQTWANNNLGVGRVVVS